MNEIRKIAHLHLSDYMGNKYTLLCFLKNKAITYSLYGSWNSSGTPNSLSNLQCTLPVYPNPGETEDMFVDRIIQIIDRDSVKYVFKKVPVEVEFA